MIPTECSSFNAKKQQTNELDVTDHAATKGGSEDVKQAILVSSETKQSVCDILHDDFRDRGERCKTSVETELRVSVGLLLGNRTYSVRHLIKLESTISNNFR